MTQPDASDQSLLISFLTLRRAIGVIGLALPFALALGKLLLQGPGLQDSVSGYYYTVMGDVFVGSLCAIGVFLLSYRGYDLRDDIAANVASVSAVGVALFPTASGPAPPPHEALISKVHHGFAAILFLTLAYFSLVLFRKTNDPRGPQGRKRQRNAVYTVAGWTILASMALIVIVFRLPPGSPVLALDPVFWLESLAIVAFGFSWITKGEAILADVGDPVEIVDEPQIVRTEARSVALLHVTVPRLEIQTVMGPGLQELKAAVAAQGVAITGPWFTHHLRMDPAVFDFEIGVPVAAPVSPAGRVNPGTWPATRMARTVHRGGYEKLGEAWGAFDAWIKASGHTPAADLWERYLVGPESGPDPSTYRTELNRPLVG